MIHLPSKDKDNPPAHIISAGACRQIHRVVLATDGNLYTSHYYPSDAVTLLLRAYSLQKTVLGQFEGPKCNYCESKIEFAVTLQVEHYRPKAKVDAQDNNGQALNGYYWLGLEWSNLLLSCPKCNGRDAKGFRFPIAGVRAQPINPVTLPNTLNRVGCFANEDPLLAEQPLLLNPEIDLPEDFLTFDKDGKLLSHGAGALRGDTTITILQLNRDLLYAARQEVRNDFFNDILDHISIFELGDYDENALKGSFKMISRKILKRKQPSQSYTLWGIYLNVNVEVCLISMIDVRFQELFRLAYNEVVNEAAIAIAV